MNDLRYCFEQSFVSKTLAAAAPGGLSVIDIDGIPSEEIQKALSRGILIYGYLNAGALEKERDYYKKYSELRLASYDGWPGEYWVDVTDAAWQSHLLDLAKKNKEAGAIGLYFDNGDIYWMCKEGFREQKSSMLRRAPDPEKVYKALADVVRAITDMGLVVMPNGADVFVRRFEEENPGVLRTVNQEGVCYLDKKPTSKEDKQYYTDYLDWAKKRGMYVRGIEYPATKEQADQARDYYKLHGWQGIYVSYHKDLKGDTPDLPAWKETAGAETKQEAPAAPAPDPAPAPAESADKPVQKAAEPAEPAPAPAPAESSDKPAQKAAEPAEPAPAQTPAEKPQAEPVPSESGAIQDGKDKTTMNNLELNNAACGAILGKYGTGQELSDNLVKKFGASAAAQIEKEMDRLGKDGSAQDFAFAVYCICGEAGRGPDRKAALGDRYERVQAKIDEISRLKDRTVRQAAQDVLDGKYGTQEIRKRLLQFNGYDVDAVQVEVNHILNPDPKPTGTHFRLWAIWFFEEDESKYGDAQAIIQYDGDGNIAHVVLIDTAMGSCSTVKKLKKAGITKLDAVVISHAHGDHYGAMTDVLETFSVGHLYLPDCTELDKYQKDYGDSIRRQEKKAKDKNIPVTYMRKGSVFTVGEIRCECLYQIPASALKEHDNHHFVNNQSTALRFTMGMWTAYMAGDLQNEANNIVIKAVPNLRADIFKVQWHGDANATNDAICRAVKPLAAWSNYHHKERSGRGITRNRLEAVGAVVARNAENGDIYFDMQGREMKLSCSKGNLSRTWQK